MQCVNCHFENMPGLDHCGRCGASLSIATAVIDVHPPRARDRHGLRLPGGVFANRIRRAVSNAVSAQFESRHVDRPPALVVARLIVPGWAQLYLGHKLRGRVFLTAYCAFVIGALLFLGTGLGSIFLGLAIAVHASSVIDLVFAATRSDLLRILYCVCYGGLVALVVYWPVSLLFSSFAVPAPIMQGKGFLQPGDVVIYNPSAYRSSQPRPGDVVVYQMASTRISSPLTRVGGHGNVIYQVGGRQIDRILAGPGQHVKAREGKLEVDGEPATQKPLNPSIGFQAGELTLPSDSYFIVPSGVPYLNGTVSSELWNYAAIVPAYQIAGKVYLRNYPLQRFAIVH
jgi:signal peptidase I